jgi:hypothetical protein
MSTVAFIGIGNSDDKLSQREWVAFQIDIRQAIQDTRSTIHGDWTSFPDSIFQNACWCVELDDEAVPEFKGVLAALAVEYKQDAIAWNQIARTEFIGPAPETITHDTAEQWSGAR